MKKKILATQEEKHNKFWIGKVEGTTLHTQWGRIGTTGQKKSYSFTNKWDAEGELNKKIRSKTRKGYEKITAADLKEKTVIAKIVGTANKMQNYSWVELQLKKKTFYKYVDAGRLQDPDCNPGLMVNMQTRKWGNVDFIISTSGCYDMSGKLISEEHKWWELAGKAHEAIVSV